MTHNVLVGLIVVMAGGLAVSTAACGDGAGAGGADARADGRDAAVAADGGGGADADPRLDADLPYDFSCAETAWPTTAPATITWAGRVMDSATNQSIGGAVIEIRAIADDAVLAGGTADQTGAFSFALSTGGNALAVYAHATATGYVASSTYPPYALSSDQPARALWMLAVADHAALVLASGATPSSGTGIIMARLNDCAVPAAQVAGASVTFAPAAEASAVLDGTDWGVGNVTTALGIVAGVNVPAGTNDLAVVSGGLTWRSWPVKSVADGFVYTPRRP